MKKQPFSNGTDFRMWHDNNCCKCIKATWYNEKTKTFPKYRCAVQKDLELASVTDGMVNQRVYDIAQNWNCPLKQTERKVYKKKKVYKNQTKLF